jgi:hypothetical protein
MYHVDGVCHGSELQTWIALNEDRPSPPGLENVFQPLLQIGSLDGILINLHGSVFFRER